MSTWRGTPFGRHQKWVFDPAARRRSLKAHAALEHAEHSLVERDPGLAPELRYDLTRETEDAIDILNAAAKRVSAAEDAAHAAAKDRS